MCASHTALGKSFDEQEREEEKGKLFVLLVDIFLLRFQTSSELKN
jgi:hypothetical protein